MSGRCWLSTRWQEYSTPGRWPICVGRSPRARIPELWRTRGSTPTRSGVDRRERLLGLAFADVRNPSKAVPRGPRVVGDVNNRLVRVRVNRDGDRIRRACAIRGYPAAGSVVLRRRSRCVVGLITFAAVDAVDAGFVEDRPR